MFFAEKVTGDFLAANHCWMCAILRVIEGDTDHFLINSEIRVGLESCIILISSFVEQHFLWVGRKFVYCYFGMLNKIDSSTR
jgi:hypothetical protein